MKTLFVGINAKFIHSNPAIRYIQKYASDRDVAIDFVEYTINQSLDLILDGIVSRNPELVGFSCYLWNIGMVRKLVVMLKQVQPEIRILLGGPEVSYDTVEMMTAVAEIDFIIAGEGEVSSTELVRNLMNGCPIEHVLGLTYRSDSGIVKNPPSAPISMADVPFIYDGAMEGLAHRIVYYETSRGCPYRCQYCLSSIEKGVRFRPIEMVKRELQFFLDAKVPQVKFVDRTFNAKPAHTWAIWRYLHEHDNGVTNFHFEISADLMDDATIEFLRGVRPGLFQFEVGVQSTHEETIVTIERKVDFDILKEKVRKVMSGGNIHMHLDLIAGLPKEDYPTFRKSFNDVMAIRPEQLQLGFLKVLKGSRIHELQNEYGIIYRQFAPYEVLSTREMTYMDLRRLKDIEELLEIYYNSGQFTTSMMYLMGLHDSDFDCYEKMASYWTANGYHQLPHSKIRLYELLYEYGKAAGADLTLLGELLKHDLCMREKPKKWPSFISQDQKIGDEVRHFYQNEALEETILASYKGYNSKQKTRMAHLERYDRIGHWQGREEINQGAEETFPPIHPSTHPPKPRWLFYDYRAKNPMTGHAKVTDVSRYILDQL